MTTGIYALPGDSQQQMGGECPAGWIEMRGLRPGDHHVAATNGEWVEAATPVPVSVSRYQLREAMRMTLYRKTDLPAWTLFDAYEEVLRNSSTPSHYQRAWDDLQLFGFDGIIFNAVADTLGLTVAQRGDLFRLAAEVKA